MSGLFASLSPGRAWEKLSSFLRVLSSTPSSSSSTSMEDDLELLRRLERTLRRIRATLHDAEEHWNIREESAKLRLKELKDLAYDIEDVVDEYEYKVNRCRVEALERSGNLRIILKRKRPEMEDLKRRRQEVEALERSAGFGSAGKSKHEEETKAFPMDTSVVPVPHELVHQAMKITEGFNEIKHFADHFTLSENDGDRRFTPDITRLRQTSSFVFEKNILGREQDKEKLIGKLLSRERGNAVGPVSVMAIVGMGGLCKTTLAQLVYNNQRIRQSFDKHAWVYVSEHFDVNTQ